MFVPAKSGVHALVLAAIAPLTAATAVDATGLVARYEDGLRIESEDGVFELRAGGRIQDDWAFIQESRDFPLDVPDGTEFRRARLYLSGTLWRVVFYKSQWDFAGGAVAPKDVYVGVTGVPLLQTLRFGQQFEPFSLNENTSSNHLTFVERAMLTAFAPSRRPGVLAYGTFANEAGTWAAGVFRDDRPGGSSGDAAGDGDYAETARVALSPVYEDGGRTAVHLGGAFSHRVPPAREVSFSFGPESHLVPKLIGTGVLSADRVLLVGLEGALVAGPFSVQTELVRAMVEGPAGAPDPSFGGYYAFASVFLTGESRAYARSGGIFSRVRPRRNLGDGGGGGAVELAARYSHVSIDDRDEGVTAGQLGTFTAGGNWYLNPNAHVALNYVLAIVERVDGALHSVLVRFHVDF